MLQIPNQLRQLLQVYLECYAKLRTPTKSTIQVQYVQVWNMGLLEYCYQGVPKVQD